MSTGVSTADLLGTIVAATRRVVEVRSDATPAAVLARAQQRQPGGREFEQALAGPSTASTVRPAGARVIAECKRRSPSKGILREQYNPADHARAYALAGAAAISVLTEPTFFDGHPDHLRQVRAAVDIPLLRKDFIVSEYQLLEAAVLGADAALLIVGALTDSELVRLLAAAETLGLATLVEVHDLDEMRRALDAGARIIGVNSRNLRTLTVDLGVLDLIVEQLPDAVTAVAESGIRTPADISRLTAAGYDAFLVGERLITQTGPRSGVARAAWRMIGIRDERSVMSDSPLRVKVCGLLRVEDAVLAVELGATAVGFIFWPRSPRFIDPATARTIASALPPAVARVGVFVDQAAEFVKQVAETVPLDAVQLHGNESVADYAQVGVPLIKAIAVVGSVRWQRHGCRPGGCDGIARCARPRAARRHWPHDRLERCRGDGRTPPHNSVRRVESAECVGGGRQGPAVHG